MPEPRPRTPVTDPPSTALKLLGRAYAVFDQLTVCTQHAGRSAAAISPGGEHARIRKGDLEVPNEDAVLVIDQGDLTLLAVADGHHGHFASHAVIDTLAALPIPKDPLALLGSLRALAREGREQPTDQQLQAGTTLLIAVLDRTRAHGFGLSFGDSSLMVVGTGAPPQLHNRKAKTYLNPWFAASLDPRRALEFSFAAPPDALVAAFTDGIDECHYGQPATSVGPAQLWNLLMESRGEPESFAKSVGELAIAGVGGNPGGQDNLGIAVSRA